MTTIERTNRWRHAFVVVLVTSSVGVYTERPSILLASIIGVAYAAYPLLTPEPTVDLALSRTVSDESPEHGDPVRVTVTVRNTGTRTVADLRLIDGVPPLLPVTDGSAQQTATLRPGGSTTVRYTVTAKHGFHRFEPAAAIVHDISGGKRVQTSITAADASVDALDCSVDVRTVRRRTHRSGGVATAATSGRGIELYQTRAYQRGDPANRIDWRRFARTGELTTVEHRAQRQSSVVLCLDARAKSVRSARPNEPDAVAYSVAAATELLSVRLEEGYRVGIAVVGPEFAWLPPAMGREHHEQAVQLLETHRVRGSTQANTRRETADRSEQLHTLFRQGDAEVMLFTPLLDDFGVTAARQCEANGSPVTVISPNSTAGETLGGELTRIERRNRVQSLRESRIPVCDWTPGDPIVWTERSAR